MNEHPAGRGRVPAEGTPHLVAVDVRAFRCLLNVHAPLHHVQEELEEVLVLAVATLNGEGEEGLSVLQGQARRESGPGTFSRLHDVEGIVSRIGDEALGPLAQADAGPPGDDRGNPASAGGDGDHPSLLVRGLDGRGSGVEVLLIELLAVDPLSPSATAPPRG